jgi:periplasmic divalent cation tolerance protein
MIGGGTRVAGQTRIAWLRTNVAPRSAARRLARAALAARLAACANLEEVESLYWWRGRIENRAEISVVFKTDPSRLRQLRQFIEQRHPYEVPYLAWGAGEQVPPSYARWAKAETAGSRTRPRPSSKRRTTPRTR